ncbi:MAG: DUF3990 domain-containing protein, partial [Anaerovoracaceae bacterium]
LDITSISLNMCRPYKDFGKGFYVTALEAQAKKMAHRVSRIYGGRPFVNVYEIGEDFLSRKDLSVKNFGVKVSKEWAMFVMNNRSRTFTDFGNELCNLDCKYDIVAGPVADDDMAMLFREYHKHSISLEILLSELAYKDATSQVSFHTEKAIRLLRKVDTIHE